MIISFPNGMTIKELKELILNLPDTDDDGDPYEVWITNCGGLTNVVKEFAHLNKTENGSDILLS